MNSTGAESRHIGMHIDRPVEAVYAFASDPENLPAWAHGVGESVERADGQWVAESTALGRVVITFAPRNNLGVLDHHVTLPSGETVYNPVRVIADDGGSEVVFTLRRRPDMSDADFRRDAEWVTADLARLRDAVEAS